jgi:enamine deaminase RidA (YjgF/YER057c/UK114 family)
MKKAISPPAFAHYPEEWHFSPLIDTGDFVFISGVTSCRPDNTVASGPETQFRDTFNFVRLHLDAANLSFDDIVEMTTYHVDLRRHLAAFMRVKDEFISPPYPAWTAIGVSELITEGVLIEIRVIAKRS